MSSASAAARVLRDQARARTAFARRFFRSQGFDILGLEAMRALEGQYIPWNSMAMRPSAVATVLNEAVVNQREHVVECGAGISTMFLARLFAQRGTGFVTSIDHDEAWAATMAAMIHAEGLGDHAAIIVAPLTETQRGWNGSSRWYDEPTARAAVTLPIDMLIVDGPPAHLPNDPFSRYPALGCFADQMASRCAVVLDDINRRAEESIARRWGKEHGLRFEMLRANGSIAIAHRGPAFIASL